jgi:putative oxidoreductase
MDPLAFLMYLREAQATKSESGKERTRGRMEAQRVAGVHGWGLTVLRIVVGLVFLVHGLQKLLVMGFGGVAGFLGSLGVPAPGLFAVVVTLVELLGGAALILGLFTRLAAILLAVDMLVAILTVHLANGFFASEGGYEFPLVLLAACVALAVTGAGEAALDGALARRTRNPTLG